MAAQIDTALFEGDNIPKHLQEIEGNINSTMRQKLKRKEQTALEKSTLQKLKQLYTIKDDIKPFNTLALDAKVIRQEDYLHAFLLLSKLKTEIERLQEKKKDIQGKLFTIKNEIEKTLQDEQNQSLLNNQLLYAFYKISQKKIEKSHFLYEKLLNKAFKSFQSSLSRVHFKGQKQQNIIQHSDKKIDLIKNKSLLLNIDKDSEAKRDTKAQKEIKAKEKTLQLESDTTSIKKIKAQTLLALKQLQEKNIKAFLTHTEALKTDIETLSPTENERFKTLLQLLLEFENHRFKNTPISLASTEVGFKKIQEGVTSFFHKTLFVYEEKAFSFQTIVTFFAIIMIGFIIAKFYTNIVNRYHIKNRIKSLSAARLVANSGYYFIILSTFFIALKTIGLDIHTILLLFGAILLWLALGLQGFISNYAMGILIKIDRSIRIGDMIELDTHTVGNVDDMNFRAITIKTSDNNRITIPNSRFISGHFINHSLEENIRRIHIPFSVDKDLPFEIVQARILTLLKASTIPYLAEKKAQVIIHSIQRRVTKYTLLVWINQHKDYDSSLVKSSFLVLVQRGLSDLRELK